MIPYTSILSLYLKQHWHRIFSFVAPLYCLPLYFRILPNELLDGSWQRAVNIAVKNQLVFGNDFIFTYGPLGYLSTRVGLGIHQWVLLAADVFLFCGYYHFIHKYIVRNKWWMLVGFIAMLMLRSNPYNQNLFLIYILFIATGFQKGFKDKFGLVFIALAGALLFFIKINYGVIALGIAACLSMYLLITNYRAAVLYLLSTTAMFGVIYASVHINLINYIKYGLPLVKNYDEAMYVPIQFKSAAFISFLCSLLVFSSSMIWYLMSQLKNKSININKLIACGTLCCAFFLFYKNGFSRADYGHTGDYFAVLPFFLVAVFLLLGLGAYRLPKVIITIVLLVSGYNLALPDIENKNIEVKYDLSFLTHYNYIDWLFENTYEAKRDFLLMHPNSLAMIKDKTIDIFPTQIALLQYNHLNYVPRPIPQSYSVYAHELDSVNAAHFYQPTKRPALAMLRNESVDNRYEFWDESLTKAVIHLNYNYLGVVSTNQADSLENNTHNSFVLLQAKGQSSLYPQMQQCGAIQAKMNQMVPIQYSDNVAIYMYANIHYNTAGKVRRVLLQPPLVDITLYFSDGSHTQYRAVVPIVASGVLINKAILNNTDLRDFLMGNIKRLKNITGFSFNSTSKGLEEGIDITFKQFKNY